jgi:ABC-2 type transport system ATP-binding protein
VLLTTHYMFEADELCDRIAVINRADRRRGHRRGPEGDRRRPDRRRDRGLRDQRGRDRARRGAPGVTSVVGRGARPVAGAARPVGQGLELTQTLLGLLDGATIGPVAAREPTLEDAYVAWWASVRTAGSSSSGSASTSRA